MALSIPTSMFLSFLVLGALGVSMNMIVLFSLILALGMLVDNAIVIVENIYRYLEEGWDRVTASKKATGEVAMPVIAATLTTLAAFAPLLFWPGMIGDFMGYLPLTLIITLSSSLFVAVIIIPTLCSMFIRLDDAPKKPLTKAARRTVIGLTGLFLLIVAGMNWLTAVLFVLTAVLAVVAHKFVLHRVEDWFQEKGIPDLDPVLREAALVGSGAPGRGAGLGPGRPWSSPSCSSASSTTVWSSSPRAFPRSSSGLTWRVRWVPGPKSPTGSRPFWRRRSRGSTGWPTPSRW